MVGSLGVERRTGKGLFLVSHVSGKSERIKRMSKTMPAKTGGKEWALLSCSRVSVPRACQGLSRVHV